MERDRDGECLASRALPETALPVPALGCDADAKLAREEASRGLLADVTALERLPPPNAPVVWLEPGGEANEVEEEFDDCLLVTCRFAPTAAALNVRLVGDPKTAREGLPLELPARSSLALPVAMGGMPRRTVCRLPPVFHADVCGLVLLELGGPAVGCGLETGSVGMAEEGGRLIDTARTSEVSAAVEI